MTDITGPNAQCEVWVQDLTDRNMFFNRQAGLKLSEAALKHRVNRLVKIVYDSEHAVTLPLGYVRSADGEIAVDLTSAAVVLQVFEFHAHGLSAEKIARKLDGNSSRNGIAWTPANVREILSNEDVYQSGKLGSD